jgi:antitoxin ParD1/3/4
MDVAIGILCQSIYCFGLTNLKAIPMPTRNVVLTEHHEDIIERMVESGRYQNASEVLREGLRLIEQRENREAAKLQALRDAAQIGFADLDESRFVDIPDNELEDFIADLGREAAIQQRKASV